MTESHVMLLLSHQDAVYQSMLLIQDLKGLAFIVLVLTSLPRLGQTAGQAAHRALDHSQGTRVQNLFPNTDFPKP